MTDKTDKANNGAATPGSGSPAPTLSVRPDQQEVTFEHPQFDNWQDDGSPESKDSGQLDLILNIPVTLSMEIGRTRLSIGDLLHLSPGSVLKLERPVGEPLDILVNGTLVARGEVVVVKEKFGMRITDIVSQEERVKMLK